jgi:hypothetical protein
MNHYENWAVRARIAEFLGAEWNGASPAAQYFAFDISQYADPLFTRFTRVAYSRYVNIQQSVDSEPVRNLPPLFVIPLYEMNVREAVQVMQDPNAVIALASYASTKIPDCSAGTENLLNSYLSSELAQFHCDFYSEDPEAPDRWPAMYERIDMNRLPLCVQFLLQNQNDLLRRPLKPAKSCDYVVIARLALSSYLWIDCVAVRARF